MPIAARLQRSSQPTHNRILANLPPLIPIWTTHSSLGSIIDLSTGSFSILGVSVTLREAAAPRFMDKEKTEAYHVLYVYIHKYVNYNYYILYFLYSIFYIAYVSNISYVII